MAEITVSKLNKEIKKNPAAFVAAEDKKYRDFIEGIADKATEGDRIRVILLAGPSGSGKTTSANLIAEAIKARGFESHVISLDDFYRNQTDPSYPRLESGERDFESPNALNFPEIEDTLLRIADGKDFEIPRYDFKLGARAGKTRYSKITHGCLVIEGLHALHPDICDSVPADKCLKIFISVSTNINDRGKRILSGRKLRFVRRMVRDSIHRGADAERTLELWANVLSGEDKYLYPYRGNADICFNTFHGYEPALMRSYAIELISDGLAKKNSYVKTVRSALLRSEEIDESIVPADSLMREFIN